ncbi:hypothetical protein, partial [Delftia sp. ASV31]|uniref:hypothetical protein n=1 Tax=Delftia sp. ASV31 TaxID=2795113 RepID=UPI001E65B10D
PPPPPFFTHPPTPDLYTVRISSAASDVYKRQAIYFVVPDESGACGLQCKETNAKYQQQGK